MSVKYRNANGAEVPVSGTLVAANVATTVSSNDNRPVSSAGVYNYTNNLVKASPYSFIVSSNIAAFNRKFVKQGSSITWTATHTGRLTLRFLKAGDGYSLYLNKNGYLVDSYDNFFGTDSQSSGCTQASITLVAWVEKGNTIVLESNLPSTTSVNQTFFCQTGLLSYNPNYD